MSDISVGDPVVLVDASGLEYGLTDGMKGWANSVTYVDKCYVFFMPEDSKEMYVMTADRLVVDEEKKAAGLELGANTISKE